MEAQNKMTALLRNEDELREELRALINRLSIDNTLGAHDFVLSDYLIRCLKNLALFYSIEKSIDQAKLKTIAIELRALINRLSIDNTLGAHDFVLSDYLIRCLKNLALFTAIEKSLDQPKLIE